MPRTQVMAPSAPERSGVAARISRFSLDDDAVIAGTFGGTGGVPPCSHCGAPLAVATGTSGARTVTLLACEPCGRCLVLESPADPPRPRMPRPTSDPATPSSGSAPEARA